LLSSIHVKNFRCFADHKVPLRSRTVIIGRNNAGKSSVVEALRLVAIVTARYQSLAFHPPPKWAGLPKRDVGVSPSLEGVEFNRANVFHRYGDPPAVIVADFDNGAQIRVYIGPEAAVHAVISDAKGATVKNKSRALVTPLTRVEIMHQVAPLAREEAVLNAEYVRRNLSSSLAPLHFRNQLKLLGDLLPAFRQTAEETWPGLQVRELEGARALPGDRLALMVRDGGLVAEVATMGHGLQMWLQTMWFLARVADASTVILDEPDVYMHPDLQRRLIRHLGERFVQTVVTTHSVEIISEVSPDEILVIDRDRPESRFATSIPAVQQVVDNIGSAHNLQLARLWNARRCVLVEGKDFKLLSLVHDVLFPDDRDGLATTPNMPIGGWGGWPYAIGSSMFLQNAGGEQIVVYCILDSDYHTDLQKRERYEKARASGVQLVIWKRKEIENYFLIPATIERLISQRLPKRAKAPTLNEIEAELSRIVSQQKDDLFDGLAAELQAETRSLGAGGANKAARNILEPRWRTPEGPLEAVSGKAVLGALSQWSMDQFGVSLSAGAIGKVMRPNEVPAELAAVVSAIANSVPFAAL
jgi:hypothetical protein